jgi:tetratricopeptide (TPR) repeat protein
VNISEKDLKVEERIDQYLNGKLNQVEIDHLWIDVIENKQHYDYLKTSATLKKMLSDSKEQGGSAPVYSITSAKSWQKYAMAAGFALIVGLSTIYVVNIDSGPGLQPLQSLEFTTLRSGGELSLATEPDRRIQLAVNMAVQGNASAAVLALNRIYEESENDAEKAEALMNIGIIEYNNDEFASAQRTFTKIVSSHTSDILMYERAYWYLAQTQIALGDRAAAKESIGMVISIDGAHSRMAESYLRYLR